MWLLLGLAWWGQDPQPEPGPKPEYAITTSLSMQADGTAVLQGETDLPDLTRVVVTIQSGDETKASFPLYNTVVRVKEGRFELKAAVFEGPTPPGSYIARVRFAASFQDKFAAIDAIRAAGKKADKEAAATTFVGSRESWERFREERIQRLVADIQELTRLGRALVALYARVLEGAVSRVEFGREAEDTRIKSVEIEKRNYNRLEHRHLLLTPIAEEGIEALRRLVWSIVYPLRDSKDKSKEECELLQVAAEGRLRQLEETAAVQLEKLGLPVEPAVAARKSLADIRRSGNDLRNAFEELVGQDSAPASVRRQADSHIESIRRSLLGLAHHLPRTDYETLVSITGAFDQAVEALREFADRPNSTSRDDFDRKFAEFERSLDGLLRDPK